MRPALSKSIRAIGVLLFAATAFLPVHSCGSGPSAYEPHKAAAPGKGRERPVDVQVPTREIAHDMEFGWREGGALRALWHARKWYPYLLVPFWAVALALFAWGGARARRAAGWGCLGLSVAIAAFEYAYISSDYVGFLPRSWARFETVVAWLVVCTILVARRGGRSVTDAEACVSAQALLAVLHGGTFLVDDLRSWVGDGHGIGPIAHALFANYHWAYWVAMGALLLAAAPAYTRRAAPTP